MPSATMAAEAAAPSVAASLALPWLAVPLREALATQRTHALLLHGPQGVGQFEMALALAQAWLCEDTVLPGGDQPRPCGLCASCRLVQARSHPDLMVLIPEAMSAAMGWVAEGGGEEGAGAGDGGAKRKPSKEIRVADVRRILDFAHATASRDHGKVVVVYPAEAMNAIAANALLKILEEPTGRLRFVLAGSSADSLLPTIRSRCQLLRLGLPDERLATDWLRAEGVTNPDVLLAAAGGQPQEALAWFREGVDAALWLALPSQLARGEPGPLPNWPLARVVDTMFKLCHDAMRLAVGATPRYFSAEAMRAWTVHMGDTKALDAWYRELGRIARHAEHPWQATLTIESLVLQAKKACSSGPSPRPQAAGVR